MIALLEVKHIMGFSLSSLVKSQKKKGKYPSDDTPYDLFNYVTFFDKFYSHAAFSSFVSLRDCNIKIKATVPKPIKYW